MHQPSTWTLQSIGEAEKGRFEQFDHGHGECQDIGVMRAMKAVVNFRAARGIWLGKFNTVFGTH